MNSGMTASCFNMGICICLPANGLFTLIYARTDPQILVKM